MGGSLIVHYELGEQSAAGKIYLDELNCPGSNLSGETLMNSLRMTYGYDGGPQLLEQLEGLLRHAGTRRFRHATGHQSAMVRG